MNNSDWVDGMTAEELAMKLGEVNAKLDVLIVGLGREAAAVADLRDRLSKLERSRSFLLGAFACGTALGGFVVTEILLK